MQENLTPTDVGQTLRDLEARVSALEKRFEEGKAVPNSGVKKQSAKEFLISKSISAETQKVLA